MNKQVAIIWRSTYKLRPEVAAMGRVRVYPSKEVGRTLRERRSALRLTLREVSARASELGERIPPSTLVRIEQGEIDPGVRRLHILLRLYNLDADELTDRVHLESQGIEVPQGELSELLTEGEKYWKAGNFPLALAYVSAVRDIATTEPDSLLIQQRATLTFATFARHFGQIRLAQRLVDRLLCEAPHPSLIADALLLESQIWRAKGSVEVAMGMLRQAETHVARDDDKRLARVRHQEAKLLLEVGRVEESAHSLERAVEIYRRSADTFNAVKARILAIAIHARRGGLEDAAAEARQAIAEADDRQYGGLKLHAQLELGRILLQAGKPHDAVVELHRALAGAALLDDHNAEFHSHARLWQAFTVLGDQGRAKTELGRAQQLVEFVGDRSEDCDAVRKTLPILPPTASGSVSHRRVPRKGSRS